MFNAIDKQAQRMFAQFDRDFGAPLYNRFNTWNMSELEDDFFSSSDSEQDFMLQDPEHTTYRMKSVVNRNGKVTVKTVTKDPGSDWKTQVRHFDASNAIEQEDKKVAAIQEEH